VGKTVAFIPARGGSKGVIFKNIRIINGRPLIYWTLDAAVESKRVSEVFVSTDSKEIKNIVIAYGSDKIKVVDRPSGISQGLSGGTEKAMLHFAENHEFNHILLLQATSPLTTSRQLNEALWFYYNNRVDSLCAVSPLKKFIWKRHKSDCIRPAFYDPSKRPLRQNWEGELVENGALYITSKTKLLESKCRISGSIGAFIMPEEHLFEIDDFDDYSVVEFLLKHYKGECGA
jgi:N-acylneuraminate cytidylyltransferase